MSISVEDLRIRPCRIGENTSHETMRRAALHLEGVIIRSAQILCNLGQPGQHMTLVEALKALRVLENPVASLVGRADQALRGVTPPFPRSKERQNELLSDLVDVANALDALVAEHMGQQS